jgi:hypothetical protein
LVVAFVLRLRWRKDVHNDRTLRSNSYLAQASWGVRRHVRPDVDVKVLGGILAWKVQYALPRWSPRDTIFVIWVHVSFDVCVARQRDVDNYAGNGGFRNLTS